MSISVFARSPRASRLRLPAAAFALLTILTALSLAQTPGPNVRTEPGVPTSSYALDGLDNVNFFNGRLNFGLPLLKVGGRGGAQQTVMMTIDPQFPGEGKGCRGCPNYYQLTPAIWDYEVGYSPGVLEAVVEGQEMSSVECQQNIGSGFNDPARTFLKFKTSDGTEYSLYDVLHDGQVIANNEWCYTTSQNLALRGKVFVSKDGSGVTFVSDVDIYDNRYGSGPIERYLPSGVLKLRDGTRYRIDNGVVTWLSDRNGNKISYEYYPQSAPIFPLRDSAFPGRVKKITDSAGRVVDFTYDNPTGVATERYDEISYKGFGAQPRTIRVYYARLEHVLRPNEAIQTYCQLGLDCETMNGGQTANPLVVSAVVLPDNSSYHFYYNRYAELARYELPTGGAVEYDYDWGMHLSVFASDTYRRVVQRRTYPTGGTGSAYESKTTYSKPDHAYYDSRGYYAASSDGYVQVDHMANPGGTEVLVSRERHFYYGTAVAPIVSKVVPAPVAGQPVVHGSSDLLHLSWKHGREYRTEYYASNGTSLLRSVDTTWQQTTPGWWPLSADLAPNNNPRIIETVTTLADVSPNLVSKNTSISPIDGSLGFDQYNNPTDVWEYDYGQGGPGPLLRRTHTDYVTASNYTDATTGAHIRNLPATQWVSADAAGANKVSLTSYGYDQFALGDCPNIVGHDAAYSTGFATRGNLTATTRYASAANATGPVTAYLYYDIAGNVVAATDPNNNTSYVGYADNFSDGVPRNTYSLPTSTTSAVPDPSGQYGSSSPLTGSSAYDYSTGYVTAATDPNGATTTYGYNDPLDRLKTVSRPDGGTTAYTYDRSMNVSFMSDYVRTVTSLDAGRSADSYKFFDGFGRLSRTFSSEGGSPTVFITKDVQYDAMGRPWRVSNPYRTNGSGDAINPSGRWSTTLYDAAARIQSVTTPDGASVTTAYAGNKVTVTDQAGRKRSTVSDVLGRVRQVVEDPDGLAHVANYTYDPLGNLRKTEQGGQLRFFMYDSLGRLVRAKNPEQAVGSAVSNMTDPITGVGQWSIAYGYDNNGNMTARVDARGVTTNYAYDHLNRNTSAVYTVPNGSGVATTPEVRRFYDNTAAGSNGRGRLYWSQSVGVAATVYDKYDVSGRPTNYHQVYWVNNTWGQPFNVSRTYDLAGNVTSQTYPSGRKVSYGYDAGNRVNSVAGDLGDGVQRTYSTGITYDEFGGIRQEQFGTQTPLYHKLRYNSRGQLYDVRLSTGSDADSWNRGMLVNHYGSGDFQTWGTSGPNNNGNVLRGHHYVPNDDQSSSYTVFYQDYIYDPLNRLARVTESSSVNWQATYVQQYDYDRWGNRTINTSQSWGVSKPQFELSPASNQEVAEPSNRLYAAGDSARAPSQKLMRYDLAGNLVYDAFTGQGTRVYDGENRMVQAQDIYQNWSTYTYDPDGRRIKMVGVNQERWNVYGPGGEFLAEYAAGAPPVAATKEYGYRGGALVVTMSSGDPQRVRRFVKNLFYNSLARDPSATELQQRIDQLAQAGVQGETQLVAAAKSMARALFESTEYVSRNRDNTQYVTDLYNAYLQRGPDTLGLNHWVQNTQANGRGATLNAFEVSTEFGTMASTVYGTTSAGDNQRVDHFVQEFYYGAYQREPNGTELQTQRQRLNAAASNGLESVKAEARLMGAEIFQATGYNSTHSDSQYVTDLYEAFLQRAPDGLGLAFWVGKVQNEGRASALVGFQNSIEFGELAGTLYRETFWLVSDHVGTPRMVADKSGSLAGIMRHDYLPFGEEVGQGTGGRTSSQGFGRVDDNVRQKFTAQERDVETGLDYFNARYYSSWQGRFTGPDTFGGKVYNPQTLNLYSYAVNNPLRWVDPTGHSPQDPSDENDPDRKHALDENNQLFEVDENGNATDNPHSIGSEGVDVDGRPPELETSWHDVVPVWGGFRRLLFYNHTGQPERALGSFYKSSFEGAGFLYGFVGRGSLTVLELAEGAVVRDAVEETGAAAAEDALVDIVDDHVIVRGGQKPMPEPGTTFSGAYGETLEEAASGVPHGTIRSTTAGEIRANGGSVIHKPEPAYPGGPMNYRHVNIQEGGSPSTFSEPFPNPVPKAQRIPGRP